MTEHPTDALLPCPFDGATDGKLVHRSENGWWWVRCDECATEGPAVGPQHGQAGASKAWNTRMEAAKPSTPTNGEGLRAAFDLARNRLRACAINAASNSRESYEYSEWADEADAALRAPSTPIDDEGMVEKAKIAFWASLTNANAGMRWLDHDSMEEMIEAAWVGFEPPFREAAANVS